MVLRHTPTTMRSVRQTVAAVTTAPAEVDSAVVARLRGACRQMRALPLDMVRSMTVAVPCAGIDCDGAASETATHRLARAMATEYDVRVRIDRAPGQLVVRFSRADAD